MSDQVAPKTNPDADDRIARRGRLATTASPETSADYLVSLHGEVANSGASVRLFYVPDKLVLTPESFETYLDAIDRRNWENLESLALAVLDDINNEVVPRWVQVTAEQLGEDRTDSHRVLVEDRQPNWDNPPLLDRLRQW